MDYIKEFVSPYVPRPYGFIYFILNTKNGKYYVGQTTDTPKKRWIGHVSESRSKIKRLKNNYLCNAIRKYGRQSFEVRTLLTCNNQKELDDAEVFFISLFDATNSDLGYNGTAGGFGGKKTEQTKKRIGESNKGRKVSPETIALIVTANTGRKHTPEARENMSRAQKGRKHTEETKKRISLAKKGKKKTPMSEAAKVNNRLARIGKKGYPMSDKLKETLRKINSERKRTPEEKERLSQRMKGVPKSEEHKERISKAHQGKKQTPEHIAAAKAGRKAAKERREQERLEKIAPAETGA